MIFLTHLRPEKFTVFMALTVPEKQCYSVSYPVWFSRLPGSIIINGKTLHKEISFPDHMGLDSRKHGITTPVNCIRKSGRIK